MNRESQLIKNTFILAVGSFLPKFVSIITLPILTGYLTKSELGSFDVISTLISLLIPIATLQIHSGAFRFLIESRNDNEKSAIIISSILTVCLPVLLLVSCGVGVFYPGLDQVTRIALGLYFLMYGLGIILGQITRGLGYNKYYSANSIIISIVNCLCIVISVYNARAGLFGVILSYVISHTVSVVYLLYRVQIIRFFSPNALSLQMVKELVSYSWPMIPNNLSNWVLSLSDRFVITAFLGLEANAVYAVANKIPNIIIAGQAILIMAWQESASLSVNDNDAGAYYSKVFDRLLSIVVGITALLVGFAPFLFNLLIHGDYSESFRQLPILFLGILFSCMSSFLGGIYVAHMKTKSVGITTICAALINIGIDLLLVRKIGVFAGSISTLAAYLSLYVFRCIDVKKFQTMDFQIVKQVLSYAFICVMLVICYINNAKMNIVNGILGVAAFTVLNKELMAKMLKKITKRFT